MLTANNILIILPLIIKFTFTHYWAVYLPGSLHYVNFFIVVVTFIKRVGSDICIPTLRHRCVLSMHKFPHHVQVRLTFQNENPLKTRQITV